MTKDEARELLIDYMYGELDIDSQQKLELMIQQNPDLKKEFDGLMETREVLQQMPVEQPEGRIIIMEPRSTYSSFKYWLENMLSVLTPKSTFSRYSLALASFVFLFALTGRLTNLNIEYQNNGFSLSFGEQLPQEIGYTADQVELLINQVQADNAQLVAEIVQAAQEQQEFQFQQTLASFAEYLDEQRTSDLKLIDYSLTNLEETTYNRFYQTDQMLGEIIETVSYNR